MTALPRFGALLRDDGLTDFTLWAPTAQTVELLLLTAVPQRLPLKPLADGLWQTTTTAPAGTRYRFVLDGQRERPDPASRCQPDGVHGPSAVVDQRFDWQDAAWHGVPQRDLVIYELHVGTFSAAGSFTAIIPQLAALRDLGITAIELMPVAEFPGRRNWGYDGVYWYAPHHAYGGVTGLKQLVDAAHAHGMAVLLDVVYNHLGPEGNYLWDIAPSAFTDRYRTPWGAALNYDGADSDQLRRFVLENALEWLRDYHLDGLRLDATADIYDVSPYHLLEELADRVAALRDELGRPLYLFAEHYRNDPRLARPTALGGYGLSGVWADEFHHALVSLLSGARGLYFQDFGTLGDLARALESPFVNAGTYSAFHRYRAGRAPVGLRPEQFVVFFQNHDQVGNRALGERISALIRPALLRLGTALTLLSPYLPLIFMGEEYDEPAPFQYFTEHSDPQLIENVRSGRQREFAGFVPAGVAVPDPQDAATFARSQLNQQLRGHGRHAQRSALFRALLQLRRARPALRTAPRCRVDADVLYAEYADGTLLLLHMQTEARIRLPAGNRQIVFDSNDLRWNGSGEPPARLQDGLLVCAAGLVLLHPQDS
jgi:maltooligosyltrehalose trehalohydrolase